jgi:LysR family transcriptional regulator, glycine cleavage system transcriptional activator
MTAPPPAPPPLTTLRAFVAAGRVESFQEAARTLAVTPSAVSHQIRILEEWVGAPLFERSTRQVRLTDRGSELFRSLDAAFTDIGQALTRARQESSETALRISALPLFVSAWLLPRLKRFEAAHPRISLTIDTDSRVVDLDRDNVDIAIRNVDQPTPGLAARKLMDLRAVPLCSPALAAGLADPADLVRATLIHISGRPEGWAVWLAAMGQASLQPAGHLSVDTIPAAIEAAVAGHGIMLGLDPLIRQAPRASGLVAPFPGPYPSGGAYFIVYRQSDRPRRLVRAFVDWVIDEMARDAGDPHPTHKQAHA